ncbi:RNA polymerase sigma factor [Lignipirellula cremea]|uniref:ECF RNA polymerase sigma factor SigW n=1 Tax=Lignipirellula cremea TaxID=2528010 RepID=A0A518DYE8_9BACT|nr:RNA polymerase sigma factor [Lignipirellula cremea]QDU96872.1 ECF RNA polymerase sigma factor SigW [Lignipirellula cremea]
MPGFPLPSDDGALVAAVLAGDHDAFSDLVQKYQRPLLRVAASRLGRSDWAEDAVQETFLCAFRSLHTYDSHYNFRTWLWTILLNQCRRQYQRRMRTPLVTAWSDQSDTSQPVPRETVCDSLSPQIQLLAKERAEQLEQLLAELPEAQADAMRLRFYGGLKFQEIADAMGSGLSTAKNRVRVGLTRMAEMIAQRPHRDLCQSDDPAFGPLAEDCHEL